MQVSKAFFMIARKRLLTAFIYIAIYTFIILILSSTAEDSMKDNFSSVSLTIFIADEDQTPASRALCGYLDSLHEIADLNNDEEVLADQMYYRTLDYVLTIPAGFEDSLTSGKKEALLTDVKIPGSTNGYFVDQQISQYVQSLQLYLSGGYSLTEAIAETDKSIADAVSVTTVSFETEDSSSDSRVFYFFQYLPYIFIAILFSGMTPVLVTLNKKSIKNRTTCSALTLTSKNLQLAGSCVVYSLVVWLLFAGLNVLFYGTDCFTANAMLAMLNSLVFLLFAAALALLVSYFAPDDNVISMAANIVGLTMAFLCGIFVPQTMLSPSVLNVGRFLPAYWYIRANNMLASFGNEVFDLSIYRTCILIQLLFTAAIFCITLLVSRKRKQK